MEWMARSRRLVGDVDVFSRRGGPVDMEITEILNPYVLTVLYLKTEEHRF